MTIAIIGAGPAGLIAAETLAGAGRAVTVYEHKPSPGRKFLMAGRGGLNLTHSESLQDFLRRYGDVSPQLLKAVEDYPPEAVRTWCEGLGEPTFVGSSGRVFPASFKASPLLRAWRARLGTLGVRFVHGLRWAGFDAAGTLIFADGSAAPADAALMALGGASWPRLGSDGAWTDILAARDVAIAPLRPANCGFRVAWPDGFAARYAGQPVKPVTLRFADQAVKGEVMLTEGGIEGGAVYALSRLLREAIARNGEAVLQIDLRPGVTTADLAQRLAKPRGRQSISNVLRKAGGVDGAAYGLLRATAGPALPEAPHALAALIKNLPVTLTAPADIARAISTAGGVRFDSIDDRFMLKALPGVFVAGEMLDWEAPTGGYLLQASFSTGVAAARGMLSWLGG